MDITAVVTHYWAKRDENITEIVNALMAGSLKPKEIIIWSNDEGYSPPWFKQDDDDLVKIIHSSYNYGSGSWLIAAALAECQWIFQQDNDLLVEEKTLENFAKHSSGGFKWFGLEGRNFNDAARPGYHNTTLFRALTEPERVNILLARMTFLRKTTAIGVLADLPPIGSITDDDLYVSRQAYPFVIPNGEGEGFENLEENGIGLSHQSGHFERREKVVKKLWGNR